MGSMLSPLPGQYAELDPQLHRSGSGGALVNTSEQVCAGYNRIPPPKTPKTKWHDGPARPRLPAPALFTFVTGPRAGINANDGFGGGDEIGHNLVFSTCRE